MTHIPMNPLTSRASPRRKIRYLQHRIQPGAMQKAKRFFLTRLLYPFYWLLAHRLNVPGLYFSLYLRKIAARLVFRNIANCTSAVFRQLLNPLDSVRWFEFDFAWRASIAGAYDRYLDVSSPREFPIVFLCRKKTTRVVLINPDTNDFHTTETWVSSLGLSSRCLMFNCRIEDLYLDGSYDLITSISVIEHIPDDSEAVSIMWRMLKPRGRLVITVPCAREAFEEYTDVNAYNVLQPGYDGLTFFQRIYDADLLRERIFSVLGTPALFSLYGEKKNGIYAEMLRRKMFDAVFPLWREPYAMGLTFQRYQCIENLPGLAVAGMVFVKP
jgi:SAM-dependent methyltransferase